MLLSCILTIGSASADTVKVVTQTIEPVLGDTVKTVIQKTTTSGVSAITDSLDVVGWTMLMLGWLMYWLKKLDTMNKEKKKEGVAIKIWISRFIQDNLFEIPISLISCLVMVILTTTNPELIPPSVPAIGVAGISFLIGFGASSFINGVITKYLR